MIDKSLQELRDISYELESLRDINMDDLDNLGELIENLSFFENWTKNIIFQKSNSTK